jgi:predicted NAD-dependent protein-ADP-ribosyltransferase YbiA (DUF1768 family)
MVVSVIKPEIQYNESKKIDAEDIEHNATVYEAEILGKRVAIAVGKIKYTYTGKNILYYPVYLMSKDVVRSQIGVFELESRNLSKYIDEEDREAMNVENFAKDGNNILLYSFVNKELLELSNSDPEFFKKADKANADKANADKANADKADAKEEEEEEEAEEALLGVMDLQQKHNTIIREKENESEIFETIGNADIPELLKEETKGDADKLKNPTANLNWIQKFMKNDNFRIHDVPSDGDCFFTVIMDAFRQIGKKTTIQILRKIVADAVTQDVYEQYAGLRNAFLSEIEVNKSNIEKITEKIKELKRRYAKIADKTEKEQVLKTIELMSSDKKEISRKNNLTESDLQHFRFMEGVLSLADFKEAVQKSSYWADEIAIQAIEHKLNIKMILLNEQNFTSGSEDTVMNCSSGSDNNAIPSPEYYIMTSYTGNHYKLISYKEKKILKFTEIPYYIKTLIVNKCIERNAGIFHHITDFRRFQEKFGIEPVANSYSSEPPVNSELYDDTIHFMFYERSADAKPGKGSGEKIGKQDIAEFIDLQLIANWRRMLDDEYVSPFTFDGKQWQTVEHYYQGSKFKKGFPDFYATFSLDSGSEISSNVKMAKGAGGKTGRYEKQLLRPKDVKLDTDFYGGRDRVERANALTAKFENPDLRRALKATKKAKLLHFVRGAEPEVDVLLMELRKPTASILPL